MEFAGALATAVMAVFCAIAMLGVSAKDHGREVGRRDRHAAVRAPAFRRSRRESHLVVH